MKRFVSLSLLLICVLGLCSCAKTEESGFDSTFTTLKEADKVTVHLYTGENEEALVVPVTKDLYSLIEGEWKAVNGQDGGKKLLTITVGTQHEITFFDNSRAMIYYGYANVIESDRCYYEVSLDGSVDKIAAYADKNGIEASCAAILDMFCRQEDKKNKVEALDIEAELYANDTTTVKMKSSEELDALFAGSWKSCEKRDGAKKLISMTVDSKYVLEIYEDGLARIAEINSQGDEKSVSYYNVTLDWGVDNLCKFISEKADLQKDN